MKKKVLRERPFEYLRRLGDNQPFPAETVRNWYVARAYVLDKLKDTAFAPGSAERLSVVVDGDSPLLLSVVRQLALCAHYVNYEEYDQLGRFSCRNRTVVTIVTGKDKDSILSELGKEEYLNLLIRHCKYTVFGETVNEGSYIDIEFCMVRERPQDCPVCIKEEDVTGFAAACNQEELYSIDTRKAVLTGRVYKLGAIIDNLPAEDIHSAKRYIHALDTFQYRLLAEKIRPMIDDAKWKSSQTAVRGNLSNLFCSDCFESRALSIKRFCEASGMPEQDAWEINNEALSVSEHHRWVADKLIMGFRPLLEQERLSYESLFGKNRYSYWKMLKNDSKAPSHIDLCSYRDLRRIDPDNMKYDSFLMLAIPIILKTLCLLPGGRRSCGGKVG